MLSILRCETAKVWKKPFLLTCVFGLLVINILLLWYASSDCSVPASAYQKIAEELQDLAPDERADFIEKQQERASALYALEQIDLIKAGMGELGETQITRLKEENPNLENYREEYQNGVTLQYANSIEEEKTLWDKISADSVTREEYEVFLSSVSEKAEILSGISIFGDSSVDSYEQQSMKQTAKQYQQLDNVVVSPGQSKGFLSITDSIATDLILLLLLLLFAAVSIFDEKQKGLFSLIRSMPNGRGKTIVSKIVVLIVSSGFFTVLFWGSNFIYCFFTFGIDNFTRPIQSITAFIGCPYPISIIGYFVIFLFTKWFVYTIFSMSVLLTSILFERVSTVGFVTTALLGIEAFFYFGIEPLSPYRLLRIFNVFSMIQTNTFYSTYSTIDVFGAPVSAVACVWVLFALFSVLLLAATVFVYVKKKNYQVGTPFVQKIRKRFPKLRGTPAASIWVQEAYKLLIVNKGIVLILVFALLIFPKLAQQNVYLSTDELYYKNYMQILSGELTPEKESYLQAEQQNLADAQAEITRIEQLYQENKITEIQRVQYEQPYQSILTKQNAFQRIMQYYNHLTQQGGGSFVYDSGYQILFEGNQITFLALVIFCALCFFNVFSMELKNNTVKLIRTLPKGRSYTIRCKVVLSFVVGISITGIAQGLEFFSINEVYGLNQWNASIASIPMFSVLPGWLPIWGYTAILFGLRLLAIISNTAIVLLISSVNKNSLISMLLSIFLLAAPIILSFMGINLTQYFSLLPLAQAGTSFTDSGKFIICMLYTGAAISSICFICPFLKKKMMTY